MLGKVAKEELRAGLDVGGERRGSSKVAVAKTVASGVFCWR